jgi:hypothetical protein
VCVCVLLGLLLLGRLTMGVKGSRHWQTIGPGRNTSTRYRTNRNTCSTNTNTNTSTSANTNARSSTNTGHVDPG